MLKLKPLLFLPLLSLFSCASKTELGPCVGLNSKKNPDLRYEYSANNVIVGLLFFEMIVPPVIVVLDELECPVERIK